MLQTVSRICAKQDIMRRVRGKSVDKHAEKEYNNYRWVRLNSYPLLSLVYLPYMNKGNSVR